MGKGTTSYGLTVSLSDQEANAITLAQPAGASASDKLSITAGSLLRDLARGGSMIPPEYATRIQAAIGTMDSAAIIDHVEQSVGRSGEAVRVEWVIDPTQIAFYQEQADNAGMSLQQQLKAHLDYAYANGWLGSSAPDAFKILLMPEQYRTLQEIFGKDNVTGEDVMDKLSEVATAPAFDPEEDVIMESLRGAK